MEKYRELLTLEELGLIEMYRTCVRLGAKAPTDIFMRECFERIVRCNSGDRVALTGFLPIPGQPDINVEAVKRWRLHNMGKTSCCPYMWGFKNAASEETIRGWGYEILPNGFFPSEMFDVVNIE